VSLLNLFRKAEKIAIDNSPLILTVIGVTGALTTAYLTGKATIKAVRIVDDYEWVAPGETFIPTPMKKKAELVWKCYIPAVTCAAFTVTAIIGANRIGTRRAAALAVAYGISERAFEEYREKIVEKLGKGKEATARDEIAQETIAKNPQSGSREVLISGNGTVLCYDLYTGRYFTSDMETLRGAQNTINHQILQEMSASLTDFYYEIGLKSTAISDQVGWNVDRMLELRFTTALSEDNKPCIAMGFAVSPIPNYHRIN
jgi:hypothetical protein